MRKPYVRTKELVAPSDEVMELQAKTMRGSIFLPLALLVAGVLKDVAEGNNCYITIGGTRSGDAFLITLNEEGNRYYASGDSLTSLMDSVRSLLVPEETPPTPNASEGHSKTRKGANMKEDTQLSFEVP